jgi:hypothetical protein
MIFLTKKRQQKNKHILQEKIYVTFVYTYMLEAWIQPNSGRKLPITNNNTFSVFL